MCEGLGLGRVSQPRSPVCKSVEPSPVVPGCRFSSQIADVSAAWVFGVQRIDSSENLLLWPPRTLPGSPIVRLLGRSLSRGLVPEVSRFLSGKGDSFGRVAVICQRPGQERWRSWEWSPRRLKLQSPGLPAGPWPSDVDQPAGPSAFLLFSDCGAPGAGGPGQAGALKTLSYFGGGRTVHNPA